LSVISKKYLVYDQKVTDKEIQLQDATTVCQGWINYKSNCN